MEISLLGLWRKDHFKQIIDSGRFPKKRHLGPQNGSGSLGPEKLLKIVNYAIIKETEKLKEKMVGVQVEFASGHQYPPRSTSPNNNAKKLWALVLQQGCFTPKATNFTSQGFIQTWRWECYMHNICNILLMSLLNWGDRPLGFQTSLLLTKRSLNTGSECKSSSNTGK